MPYPIVKEYSMPNYYQILHYVFPGEDQNDVSISPSQIRRTYSNKGMYSFPQKKYTYAPACLRNFQASPRKENSLQAPS